MREFELTSDKLSDGADTIEGKYDNRKDFILDPKGYFLIKIDRNKKMIHVGFCESRNVIQMIISGKTPQEVYFTASKLDLISRYDHAAYLGKELEKAYLAIKLNLDYVQDEELNINLS